MQGKCGVWTGALAVGVLSATAVGYSAMEAPHSVAQDNGDTTLNCTIPKGTEVTFEREVPEHEEGEEYSGLYVLTLKDNVELKGDSGCGVLEKTEFKVPDEIGEPDLDSDGLCKLSIQDFDDPDVNGEPKFKNGIGAVLLDLGGEKPSTFAAVADTTEHVQKSQQDKKATIKGEFRGLEGTCEAGGLGKDNQKVTLRLDQGTVKFEPKKTKK
ncbi:hypothetical protein NDR87_26860 [Nocardia sp. CDC159]|uniref:Uncharacterized protein n=1 Tax=Nocardia pulmonis TaxID=2951408 RepID=A0A9X2IZW2_9NOCA|nr:MULTISPECIES: hypothetical protein [Nocardia]MCM6777114.1 hypothetical protein [Nocardia pulmonis]MCM6789999.1 hypothetical protein [Nocardia sp. CDC159]